VQNARTAIKERQSVFIVFNVVGSGARTASRRTTSVIRANKDHRVLALKDFQDQDIEEVLKRPVFCQKKHHDNEDLKFFCKDRGVAICNTCAVTLHEGHPKMPLEEACQ